MPNFLIIGAQRSGTTSIYAYLKQHPQVYMSSIKEPKFFVFDGEEPNFGDSHDLEASVTRYQAIRNASITNIEDYRALFRGVTNQKAIGEASPHYLYSPRAPSRIKKYVPNVKLIAILRDPVERAYSNYFLDVRQGDKQFVDNFVQSVKQETNKNIDDIWSGGIHFLRKGFYYTQLMRYFDIFNYNQIRVYLYEDLKNDPIGLMYDIFCFLGVDDTFVPDISEKLSTSASYVSSKKTPFNRFQTVENAMTLFKLFIPKLVRQKIKTYINFRNENFVKPKLPKEIRKEFILIYREDILKLQDLIQRDLSKWLEV